MSRYTFPPSIRRSALGLLLGSLIAIAPMAMPSSASAAAPAVQDYVCEKFSLSGWQDVPPGGGSEPFSLSGSGNCTAGGTSYPNTAVGFSGNANIACGSSSGITVTGRFTISDGKNPAVSTSAALTLGTSSGASGRFTLGAGQIGAVEAVMTGYIFRLHGFCDSDSDPVNVQLSGALAGASTASAVTTVGSWTYYREGYLLANSAFQLLQGTHVTDGSTPCEPPDLTLSLAHGGSVADMREVAWNSATCQYIVETGTPPANVVTQDEVLDPGYEQDSATLDIPRVGYFHSAGYYRSWYEDPVKIDVNVVRNNTAWAWSGLIVVGDVKNARYYGWYSPSGWSRKDNNWQSTYNSTETTSSSFVHFYNGAFCAPYKVDSRFNRNTVNGRYDGSLHGRVHTRVTGPPCIDLLHFHTRLRFTQQS